MATVFSDDFNRTDGAPGANWTADAGTWAISGNDLNCTAGTGDNVLYYNGSIGTADYSVSAKISLAVEPVGWPSIVVRRTSAGNFYLCTYDPENNYWCVQRLLGGSSWSTILTCSAGFTTGAVMKLSVSTVGGNPTFVVYKDGEQIGSGSDSTVGKITDAGYAGFYQYDNEGNAYDDFLVETADAGEALKKSVSDSLGLAEAKSQAKGFVRHVQDLLSTVEATARTLAHGIHKSVTDAMGIAENVAKVGGFVRSVQSVLGIQGPQTGGGGSGDDEDQIASGADDGHYYTSWEGTYETLWVGLSDSNAESLGTRFQLNVPHGATITSASWQLYRNDVAAWEATYGRVKAEAADESAALDASHNTSTISSWTTAYLDYHETSLPTTLTWLSLDVADIVQEVVSRPGWVANNHILLAMLDNGSTNNNDLSFIARDHATYGATYAAKLTVEYTGGSSVEVGIPIMGFVRNVADGVLSLIESTYSKLTTTGGLALKQFSSDALGLIESATRTMSFVRLASDVLGLVERTYRKITGEDFDHAVLVGDGYADVTPQQVVRTSGNYAYVASWRFMEYPLGTSGTGLGQTLRMYKADQTGIPTSFARQDIEENEPVDVNAWSIAIDGNDLIHVAYTKRLSWSSGTGIDDSFLYATFNTGTDTWSALSTIDSADVYEIGQGDELISLAIDASGVAHVAYLKGANMASRRIYYRNNSGGSWGDATQIDSEHTYDTNVKAWHPGIRFDRDGRIVVTWIAGAWNDDTNGTILARVYDGGSWSAERTVATSTWIGIDTGTRLYIDQKNRYHICYLSGTGKYVRYSFSDNLAETWTANNPSDQIGDDPAPAPGPLGTVRIYAHGPETSSAEDISYVYWEGDGGTDPWGDDIEYTPSNQLDCSPNVRWSRFHHFHPSYQDVLYWRSTYGPNVLYMGTDRTTWPLFRSLTEALGLVESTYQKVTTTVSGVVQRVIDSLGLSENSGRNLGYRRPINDPLNISDSYGRNLTYRRAVSESLSLSETTPRALVFLRRIADSLGLLEVPSRLGSLRRWGNDWIQLGEWGKAKKTTSDLTPGSSGPRYPTASSTATGDASEVGFAWGTPEAIYADDGSGSGSTNYAYITDNAFDVETSYVLNGITFGFTIDAGATITGIVVEIQHRGSSTLTTDYRVQLRNASGTLFGDNKASATGWNATSDTTVSYGSSSDMWGLTTTTLNPTVVNDADFGVAFSCTNGAPNADVFVDFIRMTIHYTTGGTSSTDYSIIHQMLRWITEQVALAEIPYRKITNLIPMILSHAVEILSLPEATWRSIVARRVSSDSLSISETTARPRVLIRRVIDALGANESIRSAMAMARSVTESLAIDEKIARLQSLVRSSVDQLGISELLTHLRGLARSVADGLTIIESSLSGLAKTISVWAGDVLGLIEQTGRSLSLSRSASDVISLIEGARRTIAFTRRADEILQIAEASISRLALRRTVSDILGLIEHKRPMAGFVRAAMELLNIIEANLSLGGLTRSVVEQLGLIESRVGQLAKSIVKSVADILSATESTGLARTLRRFISDVAGLIEQTNRPRVLVRQLSDALQISEWISRSRVLIRLAVEYLGFVEQAFDRVVTVAFQLKKFVSDSLTLAESSLKRRGFIRTISDVLGLSDLTLRPRQLARIVVEAIDVLDSYVPRRWINRAIVETEGLGDLVGTVRQLVRSAWDTLPISEATRGLTRVGQAFVEVISEVLRIFETSQPARWPVGVRTLRVIRQVSRLAVLGTSRGVRVIGALRRLIGGR